MGDMILETDRLYLRELNQGDYNDLCKILKDPEAMYAYEGAFTDEEVQEWLDRQISRYQEWNFGLWAVILKETDELIGQCGLTMQPWMDREVLEVGYLFQRQYWHNGYATEAARECKKYAFEVLKAEEVCSIIRDTNTASQNVAVRNGMIRKECWTKHFRGVDMPHYRYAAVRSASRLIILRGNSGSGKSSAAKALQKKLGRNTLVLSQDTVRREMLWAQDGEDTAAVPLLISLLYYGHEHCKFVILEGILNSKWYRPLFEIAAGLFQTKMYAYYYDLSFAETLRRHEKKNRSDFGETEMRRWWKEKDYIGFIPEKTISEEMSLDAVMDMILSDI